MRRLVRFWFKFDPSIALPTGVSLGCGVTAHDEQDAMSLMKECIFGGHDLAPIVEVIRDIDISTLDAGHVLPNMEVPVKRGIWFPRRYATIPNL